MSSVYGYLGSVEYPPHSLVYLENIGLDSEAFYCYTDNTNCCRHGDNPNGGAQGYWIFPDGNIVRSKYLANDAIFSRTRAPRALLLHRGFSATGPTGIYNCMIPDTSGNDHNTHFGIYSQLCKFSFYYHNLVDLSYSVDFSLVINFLRSIITKI